MMDSRLRDLARHRGVGIILGLLDQPHLLARAYGGVDKLDHGYLPYYRRHLGLLRLKKNTVLEIGIGSPDGYDAPTPGGSLRMWRDFFPRSIIAGFDITRKEIEYGPRVKVFQGDQSSAADLAHVTDQLGPLSIVIDDGSHLGEHQIVSFKALFPSLRMGGWYVIEDLSTSYYATHAGGLPAPDVSGVGLLKELLDAAQVQDTTFTQFPHWGERPTTEYRDVQEVHTYPGIAFVKKAS